MYYSLTVTDLWGALSDERMVLSFIYAAGSCQQSFLGPSPLGLVTIFYCLRFETSLFVASYDSQGHGGGIRPRPHTGLGYSLYSLWAVPTENTVSIVIPQQYCHCCLLIRCSGNLFTESLPNNERLLWHHVTLLIKHKLSGISPISRFV
jgi:hypothetical protein